MIDLTGKSALVTGGSRGIGRAIALRLATQGADVAFSYKGNAAAAAETTSAIEAMGRRALAVQADVSDVAAAETVVKATIQAFGKVDILVNNAGITRDDLIMRMTEDAWRDVLETNLFGAFWMIKAVTRPMLKARGGRIINMTSVSGQAGQTGQANYSAAKAGLIGLTKTLALELGGHGVTANVVAPGFVVTPMTAAVADRLGVTFEAMVEGVVRDIPVGRPGQPADIANAVSFFADPRAGFVSGQVLYVAGGPRG